MLPPIHFNIHFRFLQNPRDSPALPARPWKWSCRGMEIIRLAGYVYEEKLAIANQYLIPQTIATRRNIRECQNLFFFLRGSKTTNEVRQSAALIQWSDSCGACDRGNIWKFPEIGVHHGTPSHHPSHGWPFWDWSNHGDFGIPHFKNPRCFTI